MQNSYICSYPTVVKISFKILDLDSHSDRTTSIKMVCCLVRHPISRENFLIYISIINFIIRRQLLRLSVKLVYNCRGPAALKRKFLIEFPVGYPHRGFAGHHQHLIFFLLVAHIPPIQRNSSKFEGNSSYPATRRQEHNFIGGGNKFASVGCTTIQRRIRRDSYTYDSTTARRSFDCFSKVIKVTSTRHITADPLAAATLTY